MSRADGPPTGRNVTMCNPEFPSDDSGSVLLGDAAAAVVGAMSDDSLRLLFSSLVSYWLHDVGPGGPDEAMLERVQENIPRPERYFKRDDHQIHATCAAALAVVGMLPGSDRTEQATRLAISTIRGVVFGEVIN